MNFGIDFARFLEAFGSTFSGFLGLENRLENEAFFSDITDPEALNWRGESTHHLGSLKT